MSAAGTATRIPLSAPSITAHERERVARCLEDGWVSTAGPQVPELEEHLAELLGVQHAVAVSSGTAALHLALLAAGAGPGTAVIVPSLTFVATVNAVRYTGAEPVFADVRTESATLDPGAVAELVAESFGPGRGKRLAAIVGTDLYGHPADADALRAIARGAGAVYVEDAAESLGASYRGRPAGSLGDLSILSFNGNKVITAGGGGLVATDDEAAAARVRHLAQQARSDAVEYLHDDVGFNYRMPSLNAALALAQLDRLEELVAARRSNRAAYAARLAEVEIMGEEEWAASSFWLTAALLPEPLPRERLLEVVAACSGEGVEVRPFFAPVHTLPPYAEAGRGPLARTEALYPRGLNLPSSAGLSEDDLDRVCAVLRRALG